MVFLVVLLQINTNGVVFVPFKGDSPRPVDLDAIALYCASKGMQAVSRDIQIIHIVGMVDGVQAGQAT